MKNKKSLLLITLTLLCLMFLGISSILAADDKEITISFAWWGDTSRHEIYNSIADMFEEKYPNIKVERQPGSWTQYWDKLATQIAGGNAPDIIGMHQRFVSDYAPRGALLDLKPYVNLGILDLSNVSESVRQAGYVNNELYMIAQGVTTTGYIYNTTTFDQLGVSYPDMNWTYQEFAKKAIEVKKAAEEKGLDIWGAADDSTLFMPQFAYYARSKGETVYTSDGQIGFSEETVASWFRYWKDLRDNGVIPDAATTVEYTGLPLEQNLFNTGKVAISTIPANQLWLFQEQVKNDGQINIVRMPHFENGKNGEYIEAAYLAITSSSKHPEAAAKFINFFINNKEVQKIFKLEQGVPPSKSAIDVIYGDMTLAQKRTIKFVNETLELAEKAAYPPAGSTEITSKFEEFAQAVSFDYLNPEEAATQFIQTCKDILSN